MADVSADGLEKLQATLAGLLDRLSPAERRRVTRRIAADLRRANAARIAAQVNPDGSPFEPRKPPSSAPHALRAKRRRLRERRRKGKRVLPMFRKLRQARYLTAEASADEASVGFANPTTARVAAVHQYGLRDRVSRKPGAKVVKYAQRQLLGLTDEDEGRIIDTIMAALEG